MKTNRKSKKIPGLLLTLVMVLGLFSSFSTTVFAQNIPITFVDVYLALPEANQKPDFYGILPEGAPYHFANKKEFNAIKLPVFGSIMMNGMSWINITQSKFMALDDVFAEDDNYCVTGLLIPEKGYYFVDKVICRINEDETLVKDRKTHSTGKNSIGIGFEFTSIDLSPTIPVSDITVVLDAKTLTAVGETFTVIPTVLPNNATNKSVMFFSSDTDVATVNADTGVVTAVANGTATITATTQDGGKTATCTVTVNIPTKPAETIEIIEQIYKVNTNNYKVTSSDTYGNGTVSFIGSTKNKANLTSISIPNSIKINGNTFTVTEIADNAFKNCKALKKITIGTTITSIGNGSFEGCITLKSVSGGKSVKTIGANAFKNCKKLAKITIESKVTSIGNSSFEGCSALKTVVIGKSVNTIGANAFKNCKKLKSIQIKGTTLSIVGKNAFKSVSSKCNIKVPKSKLKAYKSLLTKKGQAKTVKIKK